MVVDQYRLGCLELARTVEISYQFFFYVHTHHRIGEYLLIDSEQVHVQQFCYSATNEWILHEYTDLTEIIYLNSIDESLSLAEIYENIDFT